MNRQLSQTQTGSVASFGRARQVRPSGEGARVGVCRLGSLRDGRFPTRKTLARPERIVFKARLTTGAKVSVQEISTIPSAERGISILPLRLILGLREAERS